MTFKQIEKEFDEEFNNINIAIVTIESTEGTVSQQPAQDRVKSFLKQSFIKYLKDECERLEKSKHKIYDNWATTHDRDDERFTKLTKEEKSYNQAISDQITHLQAQIKELEV